MPAKKPNEPEKTDRRRQRRRSASDPEHPRMVLARRREDEVYQLWLAGASLPAMQQAGGYETKAGAWKALQRARLRHRVDEIELAERRELQQARIDADRLEVSKVRSRSHPVIAQNGKVVMVERQMRDGSSQLVELEDPRVKLESVRVNDVLNRRESALWGLDAAQKLEHSGPEGGPLELEVRVAALRERAAAVTLMPDRKAIDAESTEIGEAEGSG